MHPARPARELARATQGRRGRPHPAHGFLRPAAFLAAVLLLVLLGAGCAPFQGFRGPTGPIVRVLLGYRSDRAAFRLPQGGWAQDATSGRAVHLSPGLYRVISEASFFYGSLFPRADEWSAYGPPGWGPAAFVPVHPSRADRLRLETADGRVRLRSRREIVVSARRVALQSPKGSYPGDVIFRAAGKRIAVVNRLPVEVYLRGVVPAEMWSGAPAEALKAQAVVARTTALVVLKRSSPSAGFDFCSSVDCQVYRGLTARSPRADRAIIETRGEVLTYRAEICEAPYSAVCGGHTEDASLLWSGKPLAYLRGVLDAPVRGQLDLRRERTLRRWLVENPRTYCSPGFSAAPASRRFFRWRRSLPAEQVRRQVQAKTGVDVGLPLRIRVLKRGVSGRALSVRVAGPRGQVQIDGELAIRRALAENPLPSSCFIVDETGARLEFRGAGYGHGVGMCQAGAAGMAARGRSYREILRHYYPGTHIARKY